MDSRLEDRLKKWHKQITKVQALELKYLQLDASEKAMFAKLFLNQDGTSDKKRECQAHATNDWREFKQGLAEAKAEFNKAYRELKLQEKAFDAEYLTYKIEQPAVKKNV